MDLLAIGVLAKCSWPLIFEWIWGSLLLVVVAYNLPFLKLPKKSINSGKTSTAIDLALVPKVISPQIYTKLSSNAYILVKMQKMTQLVSLPCTEDLPRSSQSLQIQSGANWSINICTSTAMASTGEDWHRNPRQAIVILQTDDTHLGYLTVPRAREIENQSQQERRIRTWKMRDSSVKFLISCRVGPGTILVDSDSEHCRLQPRDHSTKEYLLELKRCTVHVW